VLSNFSQAITLISLLIVHISHHGWWRCWRSRSSTSGRSRRRRSWSCLVGSDEEQEPKTGRDGRSWKTITTSPNRSLLGHNTISPRHLGPVHSPLVSTSLSSSSRTRSSPEWSLVQQTEFGNIGDLQHSRSWQTSSSGAAEDQVGIHSRSWRRLHPNTQTSSWQSCLGCLIEGRTERHRQQ